MFCLRRCRSYSKFTLPLPDRSRFEIFDPVSQFHKSDWIMLVYTRAHRGEGQAQERPYPAGRWPAIVRRCRFRGNRRATPGCACHRGTSIVEDRAESPSCSFRRDAEASNRSGSPVRSGQPRGPESPASCAHRPRPRGRRPLMPETWDRTPLCAPPIRIRWRLMRRQTGERIRESMIVYCSIVSTVTRCTELSTKCLDHESGA